MKICFYKPTKDSWEFFLLPVIARIHDYDTGDYIAIGWFLWSIVVEF